MSAHFFYSQICFARRACAMGRYSRSVFSQLKGLSVIQNLDTGRHKAIMQKNQVSHFCYINNFYALGIKWFYYFLSL